MRRSFAELLVDPLTKTGLALETDDDGDEVDEGVLRSADGRTYPIERGIPRVLVSEDPDQTQTRSAFAYKWTRRDSYGSEGMRSALHRWLIERYGFDSATEMRRYLGGRRRILDVGCGAGFATSAWMDESWNHAGGEWVGADISAAIDVARERLGPLPGTSFVQADAMQLPFRGETFDTIVAEGVLHHTPSTERAFAALVPLLMDGGELMVYVYRRKAPLRELADDYVRVALSELTPAEAWEALRPVTSLARSLSELEADIEVPEDVPILGIRAGRHDVQRLVYWHFAKLFWNPELEFEENLHINFDWYAPRYAHRHDEHEVRGWFGAAALKITHFDAHEAGFTVRGVRA